MGQRKKREVAAFSMDYADLAERLQRSVETGYAKIVQDGDVNSAVNAFAELLAQSVEAIEQAERAAEAAKHVRIAIIRCQMALGMTMEDIGAVHGLTRQRIGQLLRAWDESEDVTRRPR